MAMPPYTNSSPVLGHQNSSAPQSSPFGTDPTSANFTPLFDRYGNVVSASKAVTSITSDLPSPPTLHYQAPSVNSSLVVQQDAPLGDTRYLHIDRYPNGNIYVENALQAVEHIMKVCFLPHSMPVGGLGGLRMDGAWDLRPAFPSSRKPPTHMLLSSSNNFS